MDIKGRTGYCGNTTECSSGRLSGAFTYSTSAAGETYWGFQGGNHTFGGYPYFQASRSWTGSTSSNGSHSHTLTSNISLSKDNSIYGNSSTVQPNALKIRVKCKAK